jgi:hypothetical protein
LSGQKIRKLANPRRILYKKSKMVGQDMVFGNHVKPSLGWLLVMNLTNMLFF